MQRFLKLRELFSKYGRAPTPRAFLYDASVFRTLYNQARELRVPMMVNSLTGMSQLSCWIINRGTGHRHRNETYKYRLPDLESPHNPETDVLNVDLELDVNNAAPIDHAYLIFRENQMTQLANHEQYYQMVAAGIYAALTKSVIERTQINQRFSYIGIATATFEVSAVTIRRYFESLARWVAVKKLLEVDNKRVTEAVSEFWEKTNLSVPSWKQFWESYLPNAQGSMLQRVLARIDAKLKFKRDALDRALREQKVNDAQRLAEGIKRPEPEAVDQAFGEILREIGDPIQVAVQLAQRLLEEGKSVCTVEEFFRRVTEGLRSTASEMPSEVEPLRIDVTQLVIELSGPEWIFGPRFSEVEQRKIRETARDTIPRAQYTEIRRKFRELYHAWADQLNRFVARLGDCHEVLNRLERQMRHACERGITAAGAKSAFELLFGSPEKPEEAIGEQFSEMRFYRRELKPLLAKGQDEELVSGCVSIHSDVLASLRRAVFQGPADKDQLRRELEDKIESTVGITADFILDHFSLRRVVEQVRDAWRRRLRENMTDDERYHLEERFGEIFGFKPERRVDTDEIDYDFPETDDMLCHMAASLARTCKPFWVLRGQADEKFSVHIFLPSDEEKATLQDRIKEYLGELESQYVEIDVIPELSTAAGNTGVLNPFLMLAYSTQGVDDLEEIESLKYFNEPEVLDLLRNTEKEDAETIFYGGRNGGLGYTDPVYVYDYRLRNLRWCPWVSKESIHERNRKLVIQALFYALFPGTGDISQHLRNIREQLSNLNWPMPLISFDSGNWYRFQRPPLMLRNGDICEEPDMRNLEGWGEGNAVARERGLVSCFRVVMGEDEKKGTLGRHYRDRILKEAEVFWERILLKINTARVTPDFKRMIEDYESWLKQRFHVVGSNADEQTRDIWQELIRFANTMLV